MIIPYDERTRETRNRIMGNRSSWYTNKYYKSAEGNFYFYINSKNYFHIVKPCKIKYDGEFSHYEIVDYLLQKDDTLKETSCGGYYKTREACIAAIEEKLAKDA